MIEPQILIPFDRREAISLGEAAEIAKKSVSTVRGWCGRFHIGRRVVGGAWQVSRVALQMLIDGREAALQAYLAGDRDGPLVTPYFAALASRHYAGGAAFGEHRDKVTDQAAR